MSKTVVILGGSYAGVHVAHSILKTDKSAKVILVSKNSHFYWNIASVRAIVPGVIKDEQLFKPLSEALAKYPAERSELVVGSVDASDFLGKSVTVSLGEGGAKRTINYDQLVLATGARTASSSEVPWKAPGTYEETLKVLHSTAEKVKAASRIVVAGGGSTGVETAAELGFEFGKTKEIHLITSDANLLGGDSVAGAARSELAKLNVKVRTGARVSGVKTREDGKIEISIEGAAEPLITDLYLPTMGLVPNSEYVDAKFLNDKKYVEVDEYYRVKGADGVWAAGDIVSKPRAGYMITQKQAGGVGKNIVLTLAGKPPAVVKLLPMDVFALSTGRSRGVGRMGSIKMLSFMVWMAKGRTLATQYLPSYIDGSVA